MTQYAKRQPVRRVAQRKSSQTQSATQQGTPTHIDTNNLTPENILQLQRQFGNKFVTNLLQRQLAPDATPETTPLQRQSLFGIVQREPKDEDQGLLGNDTVQNDFETLGIDPEPDPEEENNEPDVQDMLGLGFDDTKKDDKGVDDTFEDWPEWGDEDNEESQKKNGKDNSIKVDDWGEDSKFGKVKNRGMIGYNAYKADNTVSELTKGHGVQDYVGKGVKGTVKGIDNLLDHGKFKQKPDDSKGSVWWSALKDALKSVTSAIKEGLKASTEFLAPVMEAIGKVADVLQEIAKYGVPFVSTIMSAVVGAYNAYSSWYTYKAFDVTAKEAQELLEANEDENTDENSQLLKDKSSKKSATYAAAKTWRAFWSKLTSFALTLGKGVSEIATLFTGGASEIAALGFQLAKSAQTGVGYAKALYKHLKGTKGVNRSKHANQIMDNADSGNEDSLKLLVSLGLTGDLWMVKLAAKLQVKYDPTYKDYTEVLYSRYLGQKKDGLVSWGSDKTNKLGSFAKDKTSNEDSKIPKKLRKLIQSQFIETDKQTALALMIEPRTPEEMHMYLQNLKEVGMYKDFAKEVMAKMKSN